MDRAARRLAVQALDGQEFERLAHDLFVQERGRHGLKLRKLRPPDHGADSLVLKVPSGVEEVVQAKRFTNRPSWSQCEASADKAVTTWSPSRLTFVFSLDFTGNQQQEFERRLVQRFPDIEVEAVTLTDLEHLLDAHPQIGPRYFGLDASEAQAAIERASRMGGQRLASGLDLLARGEELGRFGDELDPRFAYTQSSGPLEFPRPEFSQLPYLRIERVGERERVDVAIWPRDDVELPTVSFTPDDAGREALSRVREGLARGEAVTVEDGVQLGFPTPPRLIEHLTAEGYEAQAGTFRPSEPLELEVEVVGSAGPIRKQLQLYAVPSKNGDGKAFASSAESLWFELELEPLEEPQVALHVRCSARTGDDFAENAAAASFALALLAADNVTFRAVLFPDGSLSADQRFGSEEQRDLLTFMRDLHTDLAHIEKTLDVSLELPDWLTRADLDTIGTVAEILRTGQGTATVEKAENVLPAEELGRLEEVVEGLTMRKEVTYTVLGQDLNLGLAEYALPPMRIAGIHPHGTTPDSPARVEYAPTEGAQARFRLIEENGEQAQEPEDLVAE